MILITLNVSTLIFVCHLLLLRVIVATVNSSAACILIHTSIIIIVIVVYQAWLWAGQSVGYMYYLIFTEIIVAKVREIWDDQQESIFIHIITINSYYQGS